MLLAQADEGSSLQCDFTLDRDSMTIAVSAQSRLGELYGMLDAVLAKLPPAECRDPSP